MWWLSNRKVAVPGTFPSFRALPAVTHGWNRVGQFAVLAGPRGFSSRYASTSVTGISFLRTSPA